ncbi:sulfatase [Streptomyces litchfieldiae]|uniref:Sulfatase n=1 Tax=Streptomyces litchfieldiae TaxID=3075543 RepID=A0ABU2MYP2_9ACTN|nr:sulfatase [Streptomyces sp. DSM 44938]MDT0345923.1 sulfatase [Streptomyces sp. DSM 44938]
MKAVVVMFDSLNRHLLPPYDADWTHAPNFTRLAARTVTFDNCYAGSMPCMPARRELHTGRHNFLHRGWGPLEPFDDSMPELLKRHGVYTHLVSDHQHYWEDGGATYHTRYNSWEFFRGQEGDPWKGRVADPPAPPDLHSARGEIWRQDWVNRQYLDTEAKQPQTLTFDAGLEFLTDNAAEDNWFVQIETFDPHEPFFTHQRYKDLYPHDYHGPHFDWPDYTRVTETDEQVAHARYEYAALLSMCDHSLGRVLDAFDEHGLYEHTLMPTRIRGRFTPEELADIELAEPFAFTKGVRTLRVPARTAAFLGPARFGTLLFDLATDPHQERPLTDDAAELRMIRLLVEALRENDAPISQFERLGVPWDPEEVAEEHLLVAAQRETAAAARQPAARVDGFPEGRLNLRTPLTELLAEPSAADAVRRHLPGLLDSELLTIRGGGSLLQLAATTGEPARAQLTALAEELARLFPIPAVRTPA